MHPPDPEQSLQPARDCRLGRLPLAEYHYTDIDVDSELVASSVKRATVAATRGHHSVRGHSRHYKKSGVTIWIDSHYRGSGPCKTSRAAYTVH